MQKNEERITREQFERLTSVLANPNTAGWVFDIASRYVVAYFKQEGLVHEPMWQRGVSR